MKLGKELFNMESDIEKKENKELKILLKDKEVKEQTLKK